MMSAPSALADAAQQGDIGTQRADLLAQLVGLGLEAVAYVRALLSDDLDEQRAQMSVFGQAAGDVPIALVLHHASQRACVAASMVGASRCGGGV